MNILNLWGVILFLLYSSHAASIEPEALLPHTAMTSKELGVIVNLLDPQSVEVAAYYQIARNIPEENIIRVQFVNPGKNMDAITFQKIKTEIDAKTPAHIQGYAITWTTPYKVSDCMSITSAITFGFNKEYCGGCKPTKASNYFNSPSLYPYTDLHIRPSMMLAGLNVDNVKKLIDKGVASDYTKPSGDAYLVDTGGGPYNVRSSGFSEAKEQLNPAFNTYIYRPKSKVLLKSKVMFFFTGTPKVENMDKLRFLPGAMTDHLTSYGGALTMLESEGQTSALRWLEAGSSASYGTVVESCNYTAKFPVPIVAMFHYLSGTSVLEAYWKSVEWPGQGVFVGEPLAKPFAPTIKKLNSNQYELTAFSPNKRLVILQKSESIIGPFTPVGQFPMTPGINKLKFSLNSEQIGNSMVQLKWQ